MSPKMVDVLIFIPLIPALPVVATWTLPWERWITKRIPKSILGPYLLYCSFAIWHFRMSWWVVLLFAAWGIGVSASVTFQGWKAIRLKQARVWPTVEGSLIHVQEIPSENEITLSYTYKVQDKRYGGFQSFAFRKDDDAERFKDRFKEPTVPVHYRSDKPDKSVIIPEETP